MHYEVTLKYTPRDNKTAEDIRQLMTDLLADNCKEFEVGWATLNVSKPRMAYDELLEREQSRK